MKLLEKFGKVKQFDFLFHKSGPLEGQPRGYCFVNFHTKEASCYITQYNISQEVSLRYSNFPTTSYAIATAKKWCVFGWDFELLSMGHQLTDKKKIENVLGK